MILVTGGAFQGKRKFAEDLACRKKKGQNPAEIVELQAVTVNGESGDWQQFQNADVVAGIQRWIATLLETGKDPFAMVQKLLEANPGAVITLDQVGCGVVPVKASDRQYRETVGRIGCMLAEQAEEVYLINCGIARKIK